VILTMPRPDDFPAVGGVSGTVTVNLARLPAASGAQALVVPVEAVFNPVPSCASASRRSWR
jgi:hypothetical protein